MPEWIRGFGFFSFLFLKLDSLISVLSLLLPGLSLKVEAGWKRADQGKGQGRGRKQTSTKDELGAVQEIWIWKY